MTDDNQEGEGGELEKIAREQSDKLGMALRSGKRSNYKIISYPTHNMLIQLLMKPKKLEHVGEVLKSDSKEY